MRIRRLTTTFIALATITALTGAGAAQPPDPRIGKWRNKDNPANVMTYERVAGGGMKVTVDNVNRAGEESQWSYTTMLDGKDAPITGDPGRESAAVTKVDDRTNEIAYKKGGAITQYATNVVAADGKTLTVTFKNAEGKQTAVAVYTKM